MTEQQEQEFLSLYEKLDSQEQVKWWLMLSRDEIIKSETQTEIMLGNMREKVKKIESRTLNLEL